MSNLQKPGEKPNHPGIYKETGPHGGQVDDPRKINIERGDPKLPPTQEPGHRWKPMPSRKGSR